MVRGEDDGWRDATMADKGMIPRPLPEPVLILGLGNPGTRYARTRHNFGAMAVAELARRAGMDLAAGGMATRRFRSLWAKGALPSAEPWRGETRENRGKAVLALPQTYMNLSGQAARAMMDYFQLDAGHLVVVHDDLDLTPGQMKVARRGGAAGHKGVLSIMAELGTDQFIRLKLGIGRPRYGESVEDYVLEGFYADERELADQMVAKAADCLTVLAHWGVEAAMSIFHRAMQREVEG